MCVLHPYTLRSNTTSILPAIAVTDQSMTLVNGNICNITWEYSDENNDIQKIYVSHGKFHSVFVNGLLSTTMKQDIFS